MARIARAVVPGAPHHLTQRGARRLQVFFAPEDYALYLDLLTQQAKRNGLAVWAFCLMPNHVHLIVVPEGEASLARGVGETHRRYAEQTNRRHGWRGHLWQERFWSFAMDESGLHAVARYVLLNPVRAGLVERPEEWPYSSAAAHLGLGRCPVIDPEPLGRRIGDWQEWLERGGGAVDAEVARRHSASGRPLGDDRFLDEAERRLGRELRARPPGRPRRTAVPQAAPEPGLSPLPVLCESRGEERNP